MGLMIGVHLVVIVLFLITFILLRLPITIAIQHKLLNALHQQAEHILNNLYSPSIIL